VDELATGPAVDPAAVGNEVHQTQESGGNEEGEEGGKVGVHVISNTLKPKIIQIVSLD